MNIGERLLNYRKEKHLSQEEAAFKLNVSRQTISKWETGQSTPDFDKIASICELYEISADELINGSVKKEIIQEDESNNLSIDLKKKKALYIGISVFIYFLAVVWIMVSIPVYRINPIIGSAVFLVICGLATILIIYTCIVYKESKVKKEKTVADNICNILSIIFLIIYLFVSFTTFAWYITWIIWIVYGLLAEIVKLIFKLRSEENEK